MKMTRKGYLNVIILTVCCIMLVPVISSADRYEVMRELELGPGLYEETISTASSNRSFYSSKLKGVSISVQNGTEDSKHRVASALVFLNGEEIFDQNDFNHKYISMSESRDYPEDLTEVDLKVKVNGSKKSRLMVTLTGIYADDPELPVPRRYYLDRDGDGVGGPIFRISTTLPPSPPPPAAWVLIPGDRNDNDPSVQ